MRPEDQQTTTQVVVCALYHFVRIDDPTTLRDSLLELLSRESIKGTLLIAAEGLNGTVAGSRHAVDRLLEFLHTDPRFANLEHKESVAEQMPFLRTRVKLKQEIVTMGVPDIDPTQIVGTYVEPSDWNSLIDDPEVLVIDTRNEYEVQIGSFQGAVNPHTSSFREFPAYVEEHLDPKKHRKVAMFCTGGIRCEKSTAFLKSKGFDEVYHLEGGILKYLEEVPKESSRWEGECFVFDERVTVNHDLEPGSYDQCHACRMPLSHEEMQQPAYVMGVSCPHCINTKSDEDRARYIEREKQLALARSRGQSHLGAEAGIDQRNQALRKRRMRRQQRESSQQ